MDVPLPIRSFLQRRLFFSKNMTWTLEFTWENSCAPVAPCYVNEIIELLDSSACDEPGPLHEQPGVHWTTATEHGCRIHKTIIKLYENCSNWMHPKPAENSRLATTWYFGLQPWSHDCQLGKTNSLSALQITTFPSRAHQNAREGLQHVCSRHLADIAKSHDVTNLAVKISQKSRCATFFDKMAAHSSNVKTYKKHTRKHTKKKQTKCANSHLFIFLSASEAPCNLQSLPRTSRLANTLVKSRKTIKRCEKTGATQANSVSEPGSCIKLG